MQNGAVSYGRDIYESLAEYITDERYHQAVLLNGSWGSGKTWFIKEEFIPAFEQNHEEDRINDFTKSIQEKKQNADPKETAGNARRERYERIKEKTIGLDIAYQVSVADIYDSLIERYVKSESLKSYLQVQKEYVVGAFIEKARENLRTLIFAFIACDKFYPLMEYAYDVWKEEHRQEGEIVLRSIFSDLASDVIRYTVHASIAWKQREEFQTPSTEFGKIPISWRVYFPYNYPFVDGFIKKRRLEESEVGEVITDVLEDLLDTSQGRNEAYKNLMNWQLLTDGEIEKYLERLKEEIPKKKLNPDYIRNLFLSLIYISRVGIPVSIQDYVDAILSKLQDGTLSPFCGAKLLYVASYIDDEETKKRYNTILKPIYEFLKNASQEWRSNQSQFLINNEWTPDFEMKCREQEEHFIEDEKFLAYANPQMVLEKLKTASPAEISYFRSGIAYVYRISNAGDFYRADLPVITAIVDGIADEADTGSKVRDWHLGRLKEFLVSCRGRFEE